MAVLYKKPKLRVYSSYQGQESLIFNFKLEFQPCEEFLEIILDFFPGPDYEGKLIGEYNNDYVVKSMAGVGYTTTGDYLKSLSIFMNNSMEFQLEFGIRRDIQREYDKYLIFTIRDSSLFYSVNPTMEGLIPQSDMKSLISTITIDSSYAPVEGEAYNLESQYDLEDVPFIDYSDASTPYLPTMLETPVATVQFASGVPISINEGAFNQNITLSRTGDTSLNSLVRLDITSATATIPDDALLYSSKYIRFNSGETTKLITVAALIDLATDPIEPTENLILTLSPEDNATIGANSTLTVEIVNVV